MIFNGSSVFTTPVAAVVVWPNASLPNATTPSPGTADDANMQFSLWVIIVMSLTCLFTIAFILCGLFKRADAYHLPMTATGEIDVANVEGLGLQGNEGMFGVSDGGIGWA